MKNILETVHHYAITRAKDGRYVTFIPDQMKPKGRRQVRKKSEAELYRFLLEFYGVHDDGRSEMIFGDLFREWIGYKQRFIGAENMKRSLSPSTIRRYERDFEKYIAGSRLAEMTLRDINTPTLTAALAEIIKDGDMAERCAGNVIGYVREALSYAFRSEYINKDAGATLDRQMLLAQCRYTPPKASADRVLTVDELAALREATLDHARRHPKYMPDYGILLATLTGMRVGEIAALMWSAVDDDFIYVDRAERRFDYADKPCELIIGEPKNGKHRVIPQTDDTRALFDHIKQQGHSSKEGFIFCHADGRRFTAHDMSCAVDRRAAEAGVKKTSIHGIRRTVSSLLNTLLPTTAVAAMLGHTAEVNERHYDYDVAENSEKVAALKQVSTKVNILSFNTFKEKKAETA